MEKLDATNAAGWYLADNIDGGFTRAFYWDGEVIDTVTKTRNGPIAWPMFHYRNFRPLVPAPFEVCGHPDANQSEVDEHGNSRR